MTQEDVALHTEECEAIHELLLQLPLLDEGLLGQAPLNGVYFFYERGEHYSGADNGRIVRIGSHREDNRLASRLRGHYTGSPPSVFRRHVGSALIAREGIAKSKPVEDIVNEISAWYDDHMKPPEVKMQVSEYMRHNFTYRCVEVNERAQRLKLESRLIYSLAQCTGCSGSKNWLGSHAYNEKVGAAALWNDRHTTKGIVITVEDLEFLAFSVSASK